MSKLFISIYYWFRKHRVAFWISMLSTLAVFALMASRIKIEEDITSFFPKSEGNRTMMEVFSNMRISDKLIVLFSTDRVEAGEDSLFDASDRLEVMLEEKSSLIRNYSGRITSGKMSEMAGFVRDHLASFMSAEDFELLEKLDNQEVIDSLIRNDYLSLISPAGFALTDYIMSDPLGLSSGVMSRLSGLNPASEYVLRDGHVFSPDGRTMLAFIEPAHRSGETGYNDKLISHIENCLDTLSSEFPTVKTHYFGGPAVGVYNARQIKRDTLYTSVVALVIIVLFILAVFKRRRSVFLILCPVVYGAVFALAMASIFQSSISGIAIGSGAAIMGVALSYSIHLLAHQNHVKDVVQLLEEICSPLVIGSITTIGAFIGLLFTSSQLLSDFGLFAAFTLVGTMLYCLIFLPQFLMGGEHLREGRILSMIGRVSAYPFEKNRKLVAGLVILAVICCFTSTKVGFNSNMMSLNYWEPHLKESEEILTAQGDNGRKTVIFVSTGNTPEAVFSNYERTSFILDSLKNAGLIESTDNAGTFLRSPLEQKLSSEKWAGFWTPERISGIKSMVRNSAKKYGFREDAFDNALSRLSTPSHPVDYFSDEHLPDAFESWIAGSDEFRMLMSRAVIDKENIPEVYGAFSDCDEVVVFDQAYFTNQAAEMVNNDFYLILYISSFLIFFVLWLSYGRLELALLSFLPMFVSWLIIIGLMGIIGMQFNIVNIILSTFIFGMGDDFSIFILEGLLYRYKTGKTLLDSHKTAIFFSSFTMIVGIGALIFARHPALHSIAVITILGMLAVVLVAYILEPLIFNLFITVPTESGKPPYSLWSIVRDLYYYIPVFIGGIILLIISLMLMFVPVSRSRRQAAVARGMHYCCRLLLRIMPFIHSKISVLGGGKVWNAEPGVVVANHQSSLDIFVLAAIFPKLKFMVADWVMSSPLFSIIARYLGYYTKSEGYDKLTGRLERDVKDGWSVVVFPEGTRSPDGRIRRFHKGAFYMASNLGVPVIPVVMYGNRRILPKNDGFNMMEGLSVAEVLLPMKTAGVDYHILSKDAEVLVKERYSALCDKYDSAENPYFRKALVSGYIYKGPVIEWYVKIKTRLENDYAIYDTSIPDDAVVTDIGCGMGQLDYMLSMFHPRRKVTGIDYDKDKIALAEHCWMKRNLPGLCFVEGDASCIELPLSDVFILNDVLHYLPEAQQFALLEKCVGGLSEGGKILLRDGDSGNAGGQKLTVLTEFFSTRLLGFNKTSGELAFLSEDRLTDYAGRLGLKVECIYRAPHTSNALYSMTKESSDSQPGGK